MKELKEIKKLIRLIPSELGAEYLKVILGVDYFDVNKQDLFNLDKRIVAVEYSLVLDSDRVAIKEMHL